MLFTTPSRLKAAGIVGMNKRNVDYIGRNNPRHLYPLVDDKLQTKRLAVKAGLSVPDLIGVVRLQHHVSQLPTFLSDIDKFVIKPAKGSGGKGILVIVGRDGEAYIKPDGSSISHQEIKHHASNILSGLYSLGGTPDVGMIEALVNFSNVFNGFSFEGVPDIRIIVYKGYPVMAMTRLSTRDSHGKANLHQGAVGLGIDIATGQGLAAVQHGQPIQLHPDTHKNLSEFTVPAWREFLLLASRCFEMTELGYIGADIVLDEQRGPLILELNARPGLAIQIANGHGLMPRIERVETQQEIHREYEARVNYSMANFGL